MNKDEFAEIIKSTRFYQGPKKESYTQEDMYNLEEQLRNTFSSRVGGIVEDEFKVISAKAKDFESKFNEANTSKETLANEFKSKETEFTSASDELKTKYENATKKLHGFEVAEDKREASELLGGLVASGAEYDVFKTLQEPIKKVSFADDATLEDKQEAIKSIVDGYVESKPYLKPLVEERRSDNKSLITKKKQQEEQEEQEERTSSKG